MKRPFTVTWQATFVEAASPREAVKVCYEQGWFGSLDHGYFEVQDESNGERYNVDFSSRNKVPTEERSEK